MSTTTENLGLFKYDPNDDAKEKFNITKALNNNFDILDEAYASGGGGGTGSGNEGIPPSNCHNLQIEEDGETVYLTWKDPADTIINDLVLCTWAKTIIVRKAGGYPENETDGDVINTNTRRDIFSESPLVDTLPDTENDYFYRAFPVSVNGVVNLDPVNEFGNAIVYEFLDDGTNSHPAGCISYPEGCGNEHYTPVYMDYDSGTFNYGSWKDVFFMNIQKPCMLYNQNAVDDEGNSLNGQILEYLNPDDYSLTVDGEASNVSNEDCNANAMVQWHIKDLWTKVVEYATNKYHIYIANKQLDESYTNWLRYNKNGDVVDYYYHAIYDGCNINNIIRSLSGKSICKTVAGNTQIQYARNNGDNWDVWECRFVLLQNLLLMLIGKSTDTQTVFGTGRYSGGSSSSNNQLNTGTLNDKGAFHGDNSNGAVKVFGSENPWGNIWKITQGLLQKSGVLYIKYTPNTNDGTTVDDYLQTDVEGYINTGITLSGTSGGYISEMALVGGYGFLPSVVSGSSSTYVPDGCWWDTSLIGFARFGSYPVDGLLVGAFAFAVDWAVSYSNWYYGVSLSYSPPL